MTDKELLKLIGLEDRTINIGLNDEYAQMVLEKRDVKSIYENIEYVESGNLPDSALENYSKDELLLVIDSMYNYIFTKKLK